MSVFTLDSTTLAGQLYAACLLECAARKPGNVHPGQAFNDADFHAFARSSAVIAPRLTSAAKTGVGQSILDAVRASQNVAGSNTHLGIILLLAPLAAVPEGVPLSAGIPEVLRAISLSDTELIFEAIRVANPGGLGSSQSHDVREPPRVSIVEAMAVAQDRDLIARQYTNDYEDVLGFGRERFQTWLAATDDWETAVIGTQLELMAAWPDSLIQRKCGRDTAVESQARALQVLSQNHLELDVAALQELDAWLRADGHRRNPGTTADLIAAILFTAIREGDFMPPSQLDLSRLQTAVWQPVLPHSS